MTHNHDGKNPDSQHDPDTHDSKGTKRTLNDSDGGNSPKRKPDPQTDPGLRIIDSWDHNDSDDGKPHKPKPNPRYDSGPPIDDSNDRGIKRDRNDSDGGNPPKRKPDPQDDDGLQIIDSFDRIPKPKPKQYPIKARDYKTLYKKCIEEKKHMKEEFGKEIQDMNR